MDRFVVRTPESVEFSYELAGVCSRWLAWTIDAVYMTGILAAAGVVMSIAAAILEAAGLGFGLAMSLYWALLFAVLWLYHTIFEWRWAGATPGKRRMGIRAITVDGLALTFPQSFLRNTLRLVDVAPGGIVAALIAPDNPALVVIGLAGGYLLAGASCFLTRHQQRIGDIVAGTVVVRLRGSVLPSQVATRQDRYNTLAEDPAMAARLRATVTVAERDVLVSLCLRRDQLDIGVRTALFALAAEHFRRRLGVSPIAGLSDEKFVQNLTTMLLTRDAKAPDRAAAARAVPV